MTAVTDEGEEKTKTPQRETALLTYPITWDLLFRSDGNGISCQLNMKKNLTISAKSVGDLTRQALKLLKTGVAKEINGATINKTGCHANVVLF